jgi:hypothetical protein
MKKLLGALLLLISGLAFLYEFLMSFYVMTSMSLGFFFDPRAGFIIRFLFGGLSFLLLPISLVSRSLLSLYWVTNPKPLIITVLSIVGLIIADKLLTSTYIIKKPQKGDLSDKNLPQISRFDRIKIIAAIPILYFSILFGTSLTLGLGLGLILFLYDQMARSTGYVNLTILLFLGVGTFFGVTVSANSLLDSFRKRFGYIIGIPITGFNNGIYSAVKEVADKLHTQPPDHILVVLDDDFHVQNARLKLPSGETIIGNTLVIGYPFVKYLPTEEIKAIITHELAHFTGRDTVVSTRVAPAYRALRSWYKNVYALSRLQGSSGIWAALPNYFSSFLAQKIFLWFDLNLSRIDRVREARADMIGAIVYGSNTFENALQKIRWIGKLFSSAAQKDIYNFSQGHAAMYPTFYDYFDKRYMKDDTAVKQVKDLSKDDMTTSEFDRHYSYKERIAYLPLQNNKKYDETERIATPAEEKRYEDKLQKLYEEYIKSE